MPNLSGVQLVRPEPGVVRKAALTSFMCADCRDSECEKWLKGRVRTTPLAESTRADVISSVTQFLSPRSQTQARLR